MAICNCVRCVRHRQQYRVGNSPHCLHSTDDTSSSSFDDGDFATGVLMGSSFSSDSSSDSSCSVSSSDSGSSCSSSDD